MSNSRVTRAMQGTQKKSCAKLRRTRKVQYSARRLSDYSLRLTPSLVLGGCWFQQAGFWIGDLVSIEVGEGKIVISNSIPF
jgi:hypothetical protein